MLSDPRPPGYAETPTLDFSTKDDPSAEYFVLVKTGSGNVQLTTN